MKYFIGLGLLFLLVWFGGTTYISQQERQLTPEEEAKNKFVHSVALSETIRHSINHPADISDDDLGALGKILGANNVYDDQRLTAYLKLRQNMARFKAAEEMLGRAVAIQNAFNPPPEAVPFETPGTEEEEAAKAPPPQPKIHPIAQDLINKAITLHRKVKQDIDKLRPYPDPEFRFAFHYLKGEVYYRHLQLDASGETMTEVFAEILESYKKALQDRPKDTNTVINIELLIKNQKKLMNNAEQPRLQRQQNLLQQVGVGKLKGI